MLITPLVNFAFYLVAHFIAFFPVGSGFPSDVHTSVVWLGGFFGLINDIVPISTLVTAVGIVFAVEIAIYGFKTLKWIISHIPLIGGKG